MKTIFVNALLISFLFLSSCGFQLNRNKVQLINNARSVSIISVKNNSYSPELAIYLKSILQQKLAQSSIPVKTGSYGDLLVEVSVDSITTSRSDYSVDNSVQTYKHTFTANGTVIVRPNPKKQPATATISSKQKKQQRKQTLKSSKTVPLSASYSIKSIEEDLTQSDIDTYRTDALSALAQKVIDQLSDSF